VLRPYWGMVGVSITPLRHMGFLDFFWGSFFVLVVEGRKRYALTMVECVGRKHYAPTVDILVEVLYIRVIFFDK